MNQQTQQQDVAIFNNPLFGDVEVLNLNGKFYFPASKVATILGYKRPDNAIARHCILDYPWALKRGVGVQTGVKADGTPAMQIVEMNFIDEGNLYRLIAKSKLPLAQQFERWVFDEVLPLIRQTGMYMTDAVYNELVSNPGRLGQILIQYQEQIDSMRPKVEQYDTFMNSNCGFNMATVSKMLCFQAPQRKRKVIGRNQMFQILRELNILQSTTDNWNLPFQEYLDMNYFRVIARNGNSGRSHAKIEILPLGIAFIYDLLLANGYELVHREPLPMIYDNLTEAEAI